MLKKGLIITIALVVAVTMSVVGFGAPYTYNTADDVSITLTVPTIKVLDMTSSTHAITWAEVTAADLDRGYMVRNAATSFVVDSNDTTWNVTVQASADYFLVDGGPQTAAEMPISDLEYRSHIVTAATMSSITTQAFGDKITSTAATDVVTCTSSDCQGHDAEFLVDYKILMDWEDAPNDYTITLTYTLS